MKTNTLKKLVHLAIALLLPLGLVAACDDGGGGNNNNTPDPPSCTEYCSTIQANCTGADQQYGSEAECLDYCNNGAALTQGNAGETSGDTIGCRTYHGGQPAVDDPATHCPHAGPSGGNTCGSWCEVYCNLVELNCTGGNQVYADNAECMAACGMFPDDGDNLATSGNSVQCRIYHAGAPAAGDPGTHCPHTAPDGGGVCFTDPGPFVFRTDDPSSYTRVDRMGLPAVSTALISSANKDAYNDRSPADDLAVLADPTNDPMVIDMVTTVAALHNGLDDDLTTLTLVPCTIDPADPLNPVTSSCIGQTLEIAQPIPDTLKIDPAAAAAFPNGRPLDGPDVDVTLAVLLLDLPWSGNGGVGAHTPADLVGTSQVANDGTTSTTFPFLGDPF